MRHKLAGRQPSAFWYGMRKSSARTKGGEQHLFREMVQNVHEYAICMLDVKGKIATWNAGAQRIKGFTADEVIGRYFGFLYPPDDVKAGKPEQELEVAAREGSFEDEGWRLRKDGALFWASVVLTALYDEQGQISGYTKITRDLTARKRREERLRQALAEQERSEERFRLLTEAVPSVLLLVDRQGVIVDMNQRTETMFGYKRIELIGRPVEVLIPERFRADHPERRRSFAEDPKARPMGAGRDLFGLRKDGTEIPVEIGLNPLKVRDGFFVLAAINDITERKNRENDVAQALREKEVLLREIHHRVKNNLQVITSLLALQASRIKDGATLSVLREAQNRVKSMALIHQTLYQSNNFANVALSHVLSALTGGLFATYGVDRGKVLLVMRTESVQIPLDTAIPLALIANELVSNSLKYAFPHGQGKIEVALARTDDQHLVLSVEDDGIGISDQQSLEKTSALGLQLVRVLTDQVGGTLDIRLSKPTRFAVTFAMPA